MGPPFCFASLSLFFFASAHADGEGAWTIDESVVLAAPAIRERASSISFSFAWLFFFLFLRLTVGFFLCFISHFSESVFPPPGETSWDSWERGRRRERRGSGNRGKKNVITPDSFFFANRRRRSSVGTFSFSFGGWYGNDISVFLPFFFFF